MNEQELEFEDTGELKEKYKFYVTYIVEHGGNNKSYEHKIITSPFEYPLAEDLLNIDGRDKFTVNVLAVIRVV